MKPDHLFCQYHDSHRGLSADQVVNWMIESMDKQIGKLKDLLNRHGHLLDPPWSAPA
jgi:hypothetical protein